VIKIFEKLRDAYPYHENCPMCGTNMNLSLIDNIQLNNYDFAYSLKSFKSINDVVLRRITIKSGSDKDNKIVFDIDSEQLIELAISQSVNYLPIYSIGSLSPAHIVKSPINVDYDIRDGILMQGHRVDCKNCMQYAYTLQLRFDIYEMIVECAILNSEFISVEEGEDVYEIRNVYTMNKTEYSHINRKKRHDTLQLPLVSESMAKPEDVLNRIKKLLIFS